MSYNTIGIDYSQGVSSSLTIYEDYFEHKTEQPKPADEEKSPPKSKRGNITNFSRKSKNNQKKLLFGIETPPDLLITLTYPRFYPADATEWKTHLDNYARRIKYYYPEIYQTWKLEPQKRGAPHYHLFVWLNGTEINLDKFRSLISRIWYNVVGSNDEKHLKAGTQVVPVKGMEKAKLYVSKYIGKEIDASQLPEWSRPGRFWGEKNKAKRPACRKMVVYLNPDEAIQIKRLVRRWLKHRSRKYSKFLRNIPSYFILENKDFITKLIYWLKGSFLAFFDDGNSYYFDGYEWQLDNVPF